MYNLQGTQTQCIMLARRHQLVKRGPRSTGSAGGLVRVPTGTIPLFGYFTAPTLDRLDGCGYRLLCGQGVTSLPATVLAGLLGPCLAGARRRGSRGRISCVLRMVCVCLGGGGRRKLKSLPYLRVNRETCAGTLERAKMLHGCSFPIFLGC